MVELLSEPTNYAVVHLPGRRFPGVVFQGDSLNSIVQELQRLVVLAKGAQVTEELAEGISLLHERLDDAREHYEQVCKERGIELPYPRAPGDVRP